MTKDWIKDGDPIIVADAVSVEWTTMGRKKPFGRWLLKHRGNRSLPMLSTGLLRTERSRHESGA